MGLKTSVIYYSKKHPENMYSSTEFYWNIFAYLIKYTCKRSKLRAFASHLDLFFL